MFRARRTVALALVGLLAACSADQAPTAAPSPATLSPSVRAAAEASSPRLLAVEAQERARVGAVAAAGRFALDSLARLWKGGVREIRAGGSPILACAPQRYDADVRIVGPAGGVLRAGGHVLTIPAGALTQPTVITMEAPVSLAVELRFSPHGLQFAVPPTLEVSHARCLLPADFQSGVAYVDDDLSVLEWPAIRQGRGSALARIWHFSRYTLTKRSTYAVSW